MDGDRQVSPGCMEGSAELASMRPHPTAVNLLASMVPVSTLTFKVDQLTEGIVER